MIKRDFSCRMINYPLFLGSVCGLFFWGSMVFGQNSILPGTNSFSQLQVRSGIDTDNQWIQLAAVTGDPEENDYVILRGTDTDNPIFSLTSDNQSNIHVGGADGTHWDVKIQIHSGNGPGRLNLAQKLIVEPASDKYNLYITKAKGSSGYGLNTISQPLLYSTSTVTGTAPASDGSEDQRILAIVYSRKNVYRDHLNAFSYIYVSGAELTYSPERGDPLLTAVYRYRFRESTDNIYRGLGPASLEDIQNIPLLLGGISNVSTGSHANFDGGTDTTEGTVPTALHVALKFPYVVKLNYTVKYGIQLFKFSCPDTIKLKFLWKDTSLTISEGTETKTNEITITRDSFFAGVLTQVLFKYENTTFMRDASNVSQSIGNLLFVIKYTYGSGDSAVYRYSVQEIPETRIQDARNSIGSATSVFFYKKKFATAADTDDTIVALLSDDG